MKECLCSFNGCLKLEFENCENLIIVYTNKTAKGEYEIENQFSDSEDECIIDQDFEDGNNQTENKNIRLH